MSNLSVYVKQNTPTRFKDDSWVSLRGLRDGAPIVMPWYQALVLEGRAYQATASGVNAVVVTAAYVNTSMELFVDIPDGTAAIPLKVEGSFAVVDGTLVEAYAFVAKALNGTGGSDTEVTPRNLRADSPLTSGANAGAAASSKTNVTAGTEIFLSTHAPVTLDLGGLHLNQKLIDWSIGLHDHAPVLLDAASMNLVLHDPNVGTGRGDIAWAEFSESVFT